MAGLLDAILGMSGQERTEALRQLGRDLEYYVPPELRGILGFLAEMTPTATLNRAAVAGGEMLAPDRTAMERLGSAGKMLSETAGVAAPMMVAGRAAMPAAQAIQEGLLGFSVAADDVGRRVVERLNQPGPVPTMNAIFPSGSSLDEVFGFLDNNKPIYHSGPADMAEEMQKWGVEPSYGPWVREIAAGAVDDVDEFLDQTPPAAWWSGQPDWIKMKVARAAKKSVSDVTVDDIRKHGHLAIASADDYSDVAFRIGDEGLDNGEYSFVEDLAGNRMRFYETPLYSEGNYPFGIERNEIVTGEAIEPAYSLTGDDLVNFMQRRGLLDNPVGRAADDAPKGILAYHGSPHDFDRFSMGKIGTGEGAQAYGHGLYFAEAEPVAKGYRDQISKGNTSAARRALEAADGDVDRAIQDVESKLRRLDERAAAGDFGGDERRFAAQRQIQSDKIQQLKGFKETGEFNAGRMYEVNIKANPEDFLDWDKTGPEQSESVRKALTSIANKDPKIMQAFKEAMQRGDRGEIYESILQDRLGDVRLNQEAAAKRLREAGIPGIKYLDAGSRGAGEGSRNYVVFDENLIEIVRKYGIAGAALMLGMSQADLAQAMQAQQQQQPQGLLGGPQ